MELVAPILFGLGIIVTALLLLAAKEAVRWQFMRRRYRKLQATRLPLEHLDFCVKAGWDSHACNLVSSVRHALAENCGYDPLRIYPDDDFCPTFGLRYDDSVGFFVEDQKWVADLKDHSFPLEEVQSVGDFISVTLKLRTMEPGQNQPKLC